MQIVLRQGIIDRTAHEQRGTRRCCVDIHVHKVHEQGLALPQRHVVAEHDGTGDGLYDAVEAAYLRVVVQRRQFSRMP